MVRLPILQTHALCACPDSPRHTLIPIYSRSRTPRQRIAQPLLTSVTIDRPMTGLVY